MCLAGTVVASWSLVAGSSPFNDNYFLLLNSVNPLETFSKNSNEF